MTDALIAVILLGLANGAITQVVTFSGLFEPLRDWLGSRKGPLLEWAAEWAECSLCFGAWSAGVLAGGVLLFADTGLSTTDALLIAGPFTMAVHMIGLIAGHAYRALIAYHE